MRRLLPAHATGASSGAPVPLGDLALRMPRLTRRMTALHGTLLLRAQQRALARWFGAEVLVLETIGRRSGKARVTPLVYVPHRDDLVVVPANAGAAGPPAWWLNLQAAGQGVATLGRRRQTVKPRIATGTERERLWQRVAAVAPLDHYQRRTRRPLPIVVLARVNLTSAPSPHGPVVYEDGFTSESVANASASCLAMLHPTNSEVAGWMRLAAVYGDELASGELEPRVFRPGGLPARVRDLAAGGDAASGAVTGAATRRGRPPRHPRSQS